MDNKAYLDQIAVKGKRKKSGEPILTPTIIKLIVVILAAIVAVVVLGAIFSSTNRQLTDNYASLYFRVKSLADEDGPLTNYGNELKSSDLRAYTLTLNSSLSSTLNSLNGLTGQLGIDPDNLPSTVQNSEEELFTNFTGALYDAKLNGQLDRTFASEVSYQLSLLIYLESEIRAKSSSDDLAPILDNSISDLTSLQKSFTSYSNSH